MYSCVCIKQTPDSSSVYIDPISGQVDAGRFVQILNPADACALEAAVRLKEQFGGTVLALTLGPADAAGALRAALAIGADQAVRLWNPRANSWGPFAVAAALAGYISQHTPDLVLCGDSSSDWGSGSVGPAIAEYLDLPQITSVMQFAVTRDTTDGIPSLQVTRRLERSYREILAARPPLLLTVTSDLNEPRYPSLPAHMAALQATIPVHDALPLLDSAAYADQDETVILEMHTPRPLTHRIAAPISQHSAFERIGEILAGGATGRQTRIVDGSSEELARALVAFLREKGFV
ncbi:MAG TPA: hypothetical protein VNE61_09515 [Ktedonobacteraceae bacterium]|nr:hypothetical protein [Ktedonobacteraceae bacterium]